MLIGVVLIAWILYEFTIFSDRMLLQPILIGVGVLMVAIPLLPSMRRHYAMTPNRSLPEEADELARNDHHDP
jgi:hypothetical protein